MSQRRGLQEERLAGEIKRLYRLHRNQSVVAGLLSIDRQIVRRHCGVAAQDDRRDVLKAQKVDSPISPPRSPTEAPEAHYDPSVHYAPVTHTLSGHRRIACLFDMHHPYHDQVAIRSAFEFLRDWQPDLLVFGGDALDFYGISRFSKDPARSSRVQGELDSIEPTLAMASRLKCKKIWIDGNHEHRLHRHVIEHPSLFGLRSLEMPTLIGLKRDWQHLGNQSRVRVGRLLIHHGDLTGRGVSGKYPARMMLEKLRTTNVFGHLHHEDVAHTTEFDGSVSSSYASGHLCDPRLVDYVANPNWQQSFPIINLDRNGNEHVTFKRIINGTVHHEGRDYHG
jgi:predicted phosphodiesterase